MTKLNIFMVLVVLAWVAFIVWLAGVPFSTDMSYQEWR